MREGPSPHILIPIPFSSCFRASLSQPTLWAATLSLIETLFAASQPQCPPHCSPGWLKSGSLKWTFMQTLCDLSWDRINGSQTCQSFWSERGGDQSRELGRGEFNSSAGADGGWSLSYFLPSGHSLSGENEGGEVSAFSTIPSYVVWSSCPPYLVR